jgi:hypothetical protein
VVVSRACEGGRIEAEGRVESSTSWRKIEDPLSKRSGWGTVGWTQALRTDQKKRKSKINIPAARSAV